MKKRKKNPPQCLVWFRLNGLSSSQNSLIHNWCIGGCWVTSPICGEGRNKNNTIKKRVSLCAVINPKRFRNVFMIFVNLQLRTQLWNTIDLGILPSPLYLFTKWTLPYILRTQLWNTIDLGIWPSPLYLFTKWTLPYILKSKLLI